MNLSNDGQSGAPVLLEKLAQWMLVLFDGDHAQACAAMDRIEAADPDVAAAFREGKAEGLRDRLTAFVADAEQEGR